MSVHQTPWTTEEIDEVKRMADLGYTSNQIARNFNGRTRNSIIGLCHRHKITLQMRSWPNPKNQESRARNRPSKPKSFKFKLSPLTGSSHFVYEDVNKKSVPTAPVVVPEPLPLENKVWGSVSFKDLKPGIIRQCRFIEGQPAGLDTVYCGEPVLQGKSWCEGHHKIIYQSR